MVIGQDSNKREAYIYYVNNEIRNLSSTPLTPLAMTSSYMYTVEPYFPSVNRTLVEQLLHLLIEHTVNKFIQTTIYLSLSSLAVG